MEFDINKVYTAVNADELKVGSKVFLEDDLQSLKNDVFNNSLWCILDKIRTEETPLRFESDGMHYSLAYLVEPPQEPEYQPFSSVGKAKEIIDKHGGWVGCKTEKNCFLITGYMETDEDGDSVVLVNGFCHSFQRLYDNYIFVDDCSPCGELVEE